MEVIQGYVEHIVFRNEDNGYTVFHLNNDDGDLTCVGNFNYIAEGELIEVKGEYTVHSMYGTQLKVSEYEIKAPEDLISIERYLGSGAIKGVGASLAGRIVKKFREDTFRIMEEEPERLAEVRGISERMARDIALQVEEKKDMRKAMIYLQKYGVSTTLAAKIYKYYGQNTFRVLEENPYQMADHIQGIGFKTADEIAMHIGIHTDSDYRIRSGIFYTLQQSVADGHVYLIREVLMQRASALLEVEIQNMEKHLMDLAMERKVILKEGEDGLRVYPAHFYYLELNAAKMLHDLNVEYDETDVVVTKRLHQIEKETGMELDEKQQMAVIAAVRHGITILTGGPGTGKTTTIKAMIHYFRNEELELRLAAPTGRAAKRMTEATGYEAQTIHRLLEVTGNPEEENVRNGFARNEENPLEADVIIIDEMSMVDLFLMHALLSAVSVGTRLIMVGDVNQLPSVGPGSVLKDIIYSECFPVVRLNKIFRQASESDIVVNAHKINEGEHVVLDNKSRDFFFLKRDDANVIISVVLTLVMKKMPKYVDAGMLDIQVLTPMRKGLLGVERLNTILQEYLNPRSPEKKEKEFGSGLFREGDKVMQVKNNYQIEWEIRGAYGIPIEKGVGVFNGDMGIVSEINSYAEQMTVVFDDNKYIEYSFKELEQLELAYAITIHKSQGSEYPAVVIPLLSGPRMLMSRNLLYTAITRARKCVTLVGSEQVFQQMIDNEMEQKRYSTLKEQIQQWQEEE